MLRWDPKSQNLDSFVRKIQELGNDLGKDDEDVRNTFVKAMPGHVIPSIASLDNLNNMIACVKCLLGYLRMIPTTGITPNLETFTAEQFRAESRVEFNQLNMLTHSTEKLGETLGNKINRTNEKFNEKFMKVEDEINYMRQDIEKMKLKRLE